jgi:2-haloacid dehalogenase
MTVSAGGAARPNADTVVPSVCVFDVNETLLDIEFLAPLFQRLYGDRAALREWFAQLVL